MQHADTRAVPGAVARCTRARRAEGGDRHSGPGACGHQAAGAPPRTARRTAFAWPHSSARVGAPLTRPLRRQAWLHKQGDEAPSPSAEPRGAIGEGGRAGAPTGAIPAAPPPTASARRARRLHTSSHMPGSGSGSAAGSPSSRRSDLPLTPTPSPSPLAPSP